MKNHLKVDIRNDELMIKLGLRQPILTDRDPSVWTKTSYEKKQLKDAKRKYKSNKNISIRRARNKRV